MAKVVVFYLCIVFYSVLLLLSFLSLCKVIALKCDSKEQTEKYRIASKRESNQEKKHSMYNEAKKIKSDNFIIKKRKV